MDYIRKDLKIPIEITGMEYFGPEQHIIDMNEIVADQPNPIQVLGKYEGLWDGEIDDAIKTATTIQYSDRHIHPTYLYEVQDLSICPTIEKMPEALGFVKGYYKAQIQMQRPGCVFNTHVDYDIFGMIPEDLQHHGIRVLIMLANWEHGQIMGFNNAIWKEWKAGDILTSDFLNIRHFTANGSCHSRPILQVTGLPNEQLRAQIKNKQSCIINI